LTGKLLAQYQLRLDKISHAYRKLKIESIDRQAQDDVSNTNAAALRGVPKILTEQTKVL
jgi:hypothetical protein